MAREPEVVLANSKREINYSNCVVITKEPKHAVNRISLIYMEVQVLTKDKAAHATTYLPRCEDVWGPGDTPSRILNLVKDGGEWLGVWPSRK